MTAFSSLERVLFQNGTQLRVVRLWNLPLAERLLLLRQPLLCALTVSACTYCICRIYTHNFRPSSIQHRDSRNSYPGDLWRWWQAQSDSMKLTWLIMGANLIVCALWYQVPRPNFLHKYMIANVYGKAPCLSMIGAMFSHQDYLHMLLNMLSLYQVSTIMRNPAHLACIYISGGVCATLGSYIRTVLTPGLCEGSLGASGAIMSLVGYTVIAHPEVQYSVGFGLHSMFPRSVSRHLTLLSMVIFETCGLMFGWQLFDHAAHLSGLLFGGLCALTAGGRAWEQARRS